MKKNNSKISWDQLGARKISVALSVAAPLKVAVRKCVLLSVEKRKEICLEAPLHLRYSNKCLSSPRLNPQIYTHTRSPHITRAQLRNTLKSPKKEIGLMKFGKLREWSIGIEKAAASVLKFRQELIHPLIREENSKSGNYSHAIHWRWSSSSSSADEGRSEFRFLAVYSKSFRKELVKWFKSCFGGLKVISEFEDFFGLRFNFIVVSSPKWVCGRSNEKWDSARFFIRIILKKP